MITDHVATLDGLNDRSRLGTILGPGGDRLVMVGIEALAGWVLLAEPGPAEPGAKLTEDEGNALGERIGCAYLLTLSLFCRLAGLENDAGHKQRPLEIVERGQDLARDRGPPPSLRRSGLARDPLAVILQLRPSPLCQLQILIPLSFQLRNRGVPILRL